MQGDSVFIPITLFYAGIKAKLTGKKLVGVYEKYYEESSQLPFEATYNESFRFPPRGISKENIEGKWEVNFKDANETVKAIGIFKQEGDNVSGTFLTSLGDFRFLDGVVQEKTLWLSSFDGANAFLFKGDFINSNELQGHFWSGAFGYQTWHAVKNERADIPQIEKDTLINDGISTFNFNLTDLNGKMVSLSDPKYQDKVKVIHLFGTWSSSSIDEVRFLSDWHKQNKGSDVVVIGLSFEQKDDFTYSKKRVNNMINRLNAQYDFLIAGSSDRISAAEKFPVLRSIQTFPTTLILDRDNKISKINCGFRGQGSGFYHKEYIEDFNKAINELLPEGKKVNYIEQEN